MSERNPRQSRIFVAKGSWADPGGRPGSVKLRRMSADAGEASIKTCKGVHRIASAAL
jgi:hypothetical protein